MRKMKNGSFAFSKAEIALWSGSALLITASYFVFGAQSLLTLAASLVGATALIFNAKGYPLGQVLMIAFSLMYGAISLGFAYYGEMITYLGMSAPMAVFSLVSWLRHPYERGKAEVRVNRISAAETGLMFALCAGVTAAFYFILQALGTANLAPSTVSVATSFLAAYLTFRRSPFFALAYAANDAVLIALWVMAAMSDASYVSVAVCFAAFLVNDLYGFFNWRRMLRRQSAVS